jgi:regulator of protease activity HflC (stomatin/prohibitin superfamily)
VMADLIEVSERRGIDLSLEDAYNQACRLNPEIASVMEQRTKAQAATQAHQRTSRARRAASSVAGSPAGKPPSANSPRSLREALEDAYEDSAG